MISKELMGAWLNKKKTSPQRIYQIINDKRDKHDKLITKEQAAYLCAAEDGIELSKYLSPDKVHEILSIGRSLNNSSTNISTHKVKTVYKTRDNIINFDKDYKGVKDSLLPKKIFNEAQAMMRVYPKTYIFENSVRNVIRIVMKKNLGINWWGKVDINIINTVKHRAKQELESPWIGKRGEDELCYCDIKHLIKIMDDNWTYFCFLGKKEEIFTFFAIIEKIRNIIAHNNMVRENDVDSLQVFLRSWTEVVEASKEKILN